MRILVLGGAGAMAAGTVRDLLSPLSSGVTHITAADLPGDRLQALAAAHAGDPRLATLALDIRDEPALEAALSRCDLCINAVPTLAGHQMRLFEAAFRARRTYVDYGGLGIATVEQKAQHARWREAGLTAVISLGADPGLSNVLCRTVADRLERIDRIGLYWVARLVGPESPILVPPYAVSTVLAEYARPSKQFLAGRLTEVPPRALEEVIELPEPFGRSTFFCTPHSEPLTVPFASGIAEKGIREMTWKLSLPEHEHRAWIDLVKAGFGDLDDPIEIAGARITPADYLEALLRRTRARNANQIPAQDYHELHFAIGEGMVSGQKTIVKAEVSAGPDPLFVGYHDAGTSMAMSVGVQLIGRSPRLPGVHAPEEYFSTHDFLAEMARRRFQVAITTSRIEQI